MNTPKLTFARTYSTLRFFSAIMDSGRCHVIGENGRAHPFGVIDMEEATRGISYREQAVLCLLRREAALNNFLRRGGRIGRKIRTEGWIGYINHPVEFKSVLKEALNAVQQECRTQATGKVDPLILKFLGGIALGMIVAPFFAHLAYYIFHH